MTRLWRLATTAVVGAVAGGLLLTPGRAQTRETSLSLDYSAGTVGAAVATEQAHPPQIVQESREDRRLRLTLAECARLALERNPDIHLAHEALLQAETDITQARSALLPFLGAEATYTRLDKELAFALGPQVFTFMARNIYEPGIVVRQPIYSGGRLRAARKAGQYLREARFQDQRKAESEITFQVIRAYRTVQVAQSFQKVAAEAVALLEAHEHDVTILVREGANPELDLLRTRTELADARRELNGAENALDLAVSALKNLLVVDLEEPVSLIDRLDRPGRPEGDLPSFTQTALLQRPELESLKSQLAAAEQSLKAAKGERLPSLGVEGRYQYIRGHFRDLEGGAHWTLGFRAEFPLWDWRKTTAGIQKARSQADQARLQFQKAEDQIRLEVRKAFLELEKAERDIGVARTGLETATEAYRLARAGYRAGEGTNTEVLDARVGASRAEANHVRALFQCSVALASLERAVGSAPSEQVELQRKESAK